MHRLLDLGSNFAKAEWYGESSTISQLSPITTRSNLLSSHHARRRELLPRRSEWDLLTESNMQQYRAQRRHLGPVYTMNGLKRHEHHVDEVLREFLTKMTGELAGQSIELDHWIHVYALGEWSELLVKEEKARRKGPTDLYT